MEQESAAIEHDLRNAGLFGALGERLADLSGALAGRSEVRRATPPVPEEAVRGVRADVETVTTAVQERGNRG